MPPLYVVGASITVAATLGLLAAEGADSQRGRWLTKPVAAAGFVIAAWGAGALASSYGRCVLLGLALSWLGDVLLIPKSERLFLAGLGAFLLGHVAFAIGFGLRATDFAGSALSLLVVVPTALVVTRWLRPHVKPAMRAPVTAYTLVISTMVVLAVGSHAARGNLPLIAGALAFFASDLAVARDRFVRPGFVNKLWGLPLYFGAQLLLAASVGPWL